MAAINDAIGLVVDAIDESRGPGLKERIAKIEQEYKRRTQDFRDELHTQIELAIKLFEGERSRPGRQRKRPEGATA